MGWFPPVVFDPHTDADANAVNDNFNSVATAINNLANLIGEYLNSDADLSALTIYNYMHYGASQLLPSADNDNALNAMFSVISSASPNGGYALIPQCQFDIDASAQGFALPDQVIIQALGTGGTGGSEVPAVFHFNIHGTGGSLSSDPASGWCFLNSTGAHTSGGSYIRNLTMHWINSTNAGDTAIIADQWNTRAEECVFVDCPGGMQCSGLATGARGCTYQLHSGTPNGSVAFYLEGNQSYCRDGIILQVNSQYSVSNPGPSGCTAISLGNSKDIKGPTEHAQIMNMHLAQFYYGINYQLLFGVKGTNIGMTEIQSSGTCVNMVTPNPNKAIFAEKYTSCVFQKGNNSPDGSPIVYIDANGGSINIVNDIEFVSCTAWNASSVPANNQHVLELGGCSDIRLLGGRWCNAGATTGSANIAILGAPNTTANVTKKSIGSVSLVGVNLSSGYQNSQHDNSTACALYFDAIPVYPVVVYSCPMPGYNGANPVIVNNPNDIPVNMLTIKNCAGYNDLDLVLNNNTAPTGVLTAAATCSSPYYGPSKLQFVHTGALQLTTGLIGKTGTLYNVPANAFVSIYLDNPWDGVLFSTQPATFRWKGR